MNQNVNFEKPANDWFLFNGIEKIAIYSSICFRS